jgi:beta-lactam-binding protein with PASTA domain
MKKILLFFILISLLVAGMAVGAEVAGTIYNKAVLPKKVVVPNKIPVMDKAVISDMVTIPNLIGISYEQALSVLAQNELEEDEKQPSTDGVGCGDIIHKVIYQHPDAGTKVTKHSKVQLGWCR